MTDLSYFSGTPAVHTVYTRCAYACMALVISATSAVADAWNDFVRLCLAPAEAFEPYPTHLPVTNPVPGWVRVEAGERAFVLEPETRYLVIETAPEDGRRACRVHDRKGGAEDAFDAWFGAEAARGRYVAEDLPPVDTIVWDSNEIFEPVLSAQRWRDGDAVVLRMLETSDES